MITPKRIANYALKRLDDVKFASITTPSVTPEYRRIYFYHIFKAAGTSINQIFLSLGGESGVDLYPKLINSRSHRIASGGKIFVGWDKKRIEEGNYYYGFSHIPQHELHLPEDTYTFTCLRDPVARVVSHYKNLYRLVADGAYHPILETERDYLGNSFGDFLNNLPQEKLFGQIYMFSKSLNLDEAYENICKCSRFFFLEDFATGLAQIATDLNLNLTLIHSHENNIKLSIDQADKDRLREMLQPEYELIERLRPDAANREADTSRLSTAEPVKPEAEYFSPYATRAK